MFKDRLSGEVGGNCWWLSCEKDKGFYRNAAMSANVDVWVEDDMICRQGKDLYDGLKDCAYVYTNPHRKPKNKDEYFLMTDYGIYPFSIVTENDK